MAYLVKIMPRRGRDFVNLYAAIAAELQRAVFTLENNPTRYPATPESKDFATCASPTASWSVALKVKILHIRHGTQKGRRTV
jgi:hypothetical protein